MTDNIIDLNLHRKTNLVDKLVNLDETRAVVYAYLTYRLNGVRFDKLKFDYSFFYFSGY